MLCLVNRQCAPRRGCSTAALNAAAALIAAAWTLAPHAHAGTQTPVQPPWAPDAYPTPTLKSGNANGTPADNPANRVDPNVSTSPFGGVVSIDVNPPGYGSFLATGALITPKHVLTAAHPLDADDDGQWQDNLVTPANVTVNLNFTGDLSTSRVASNIVFHPAFDGFFQAVNDDWAIIELDTAIDTIVGENSGNPIPVYGLHRDIVYAGTTVTMAGYGQSGQGYLSFYPILGVNDIKRSGQNVVDSFGFDDGDGPGGTAELWNYDFDNPAGGNGPLGGPTLGNDVETITGPGDSGGSVFVGAPGAYEIAGNMTYLAAGATSAYGSQGGGNLIHPYLSWIDGLIPGLTKATAVTATAPQGQSQRFSEALSGLWFAAPEDGEAFEYTTSNTAGLFAQIKRFGADNVELFVDGQSYGVFNEGDSFSFMDTFGGFGVDTFTVATAAPFAADAALLQMEFSLGELAFDARAVTLIPTPGGLACLGLTALAAGTARRRSPRAA